MTKVEKTIRWLRNGQFSRLHRRAGKKQAARLQPQTQSHIFIQRNSSYPFLIPVFKLCQGQNCGERGALLCNEGHIELAQLIWDYRRQIRVTTNIQPAYHSRLRLLIKCKCQLTHGSFVFKGSDRRPPWQWPLTLRYYIFQRVYCRGGGDSFLY